MMMRHVQFCRVFLACVILAVQSIATCDGLPFPPSVPDVNTFLSESFHYVILGGGTSGVALGARLAEDPSLNIGIIEAGSFHKDDPIVDIPGFVGRGVGNASYDWNFLSTEQVNAGGRNLAMTRGKMLGGSSGLNGMAWNRASSPEYDAWSEFAPTRDWTWEGLLPFFRKSEKVAVSPPNPYPGITEEEAQETAHDLPRVDGFAGPVSASHNAFYFNVVPTVVETLNAIGFNTNPEPQRGNNLGVSNTFASIDRKNGVRSYSATAYYCQAPVRPNLHILTGAQATRIQFENSTSGLLATGVQFSVRSRSYVVNATKEVIISAGTIQTPQLLELSGIGNSTILNSYGIPPLIDLPGVGENFQEHLFVAVQWQLKPGHETFDVLRNNATFAAEQLSLYDTTKTGIWTDLDSTVAFLPLNTLTSSDRLSELLDTFDREAQQAPPSSLQAMQYPIQRSWIEQGNVAHFELAHWSRGFIEPAVNKSYIVVIGGISHPTSRGSIHITSSDPLVAPAIDPKFLSHEFDAMSLLDVVKFIQRIGHEPPFSEFVDTQTNPSLDMQSDDDILNYIRTTSAGGDHLIGTAAMAPREHGGVVDSSLRVYGTQNVRIVDASVFPLHIAANTQATVYAVAEKAAQMIQGE